MDKYVPKYGPEDRSPTWYEGYNAARVGWGLHPDASLPYADGYRYYKNLFRED